MNIGTIARAHQQFGGRCSRTLVKGRTACVVGERLAARAGRIFWQGFRHERDGSVARRLLSRIGWLFAQVFVAVIVNSAGLNLASHWRIIGPAKAGF